MHSNPMIAQVESLPALIRSEFENLDARARTFLNPEEWLSVKRIITTGCGDSHMAAVATQWAFERIGGVPTEAATAMRAARYAIPAAKNAIWRNPLVLAISVSGSVSRTQEAASIAREQGALSVALTGNPDSPLGRMAERVLDCRIPDFVFAPGVRSFHISLLALWLAAIRLGEMRQQISGQTAQDLRKQLLGTADAVERTIEASDQPARQLAEHLADGSHFTFVGDGPNYATALFSAAKILEAIGRDAWGQDTEEWSHLQYFSHRHPAAPTFVIDSGGPGASRVKEILSPMTRIGRDIHLIAPSNSPLAAEGASLLPVAGNVAPLFAPMVNVVPGELLAAHLADVTGEEFFGGFTGAYDPEIHGGNYINTSRVASLAEVTTAPSRT